MKITVKLFALLREGRFKTNELFLPEGTTVGDVLNELNIKIQEVSTIQVNQNFSDFNQILREGDILSLFPPIGGG